MKYLYGLMLFLALAAHAQEPFVFEDPAMQDRFASITFELRCPVCQNQNLADSDAPLAQDLRQQIYDMMMAGQSNDQIKKFMVDRYGDFVLYRPPVQPNTWLLWLAPLFMLIIGAIVLRVNIKKRAVVRDDPDETTHKSNTE